MKNKVGPPFRMTEFDIMYGLGISFEGDLLDLAIKGDVIEKLVHGFLMMVKKLVKVEKVKLLLHEDKKLVKKLEKSRIIWVQIK